MLKSNLVPKTLQTIKVALIGNPNCGKTTLFNKLTGSNRKIGNWPGVTVEQQHGQYTDSLAQLKVQVVDLPGCYSLISTPDMALDEKITCEYLLTTPDTVYINVIDASHMSRDLYLTLQLLELGAPVIVALNCMDIAKESGLKIDAKVLAENLGCPVVPIVAKNSKNIINLQHEIAIAASKSPHAQNSYQIDYPAILSTTINFWQAHLSVGQILHALEGDILLQEKLNSAGVETVTARTKISQQLGMALDLLIAKHRRMLIRQIYGASVIKKKYIKPSMSEYIDTVVLHKIFGPLIFLAVMYLMFTAAINIGGILQLVFDQYSESIFVTKFSNWLEYFGLGAAVINILANGIGKGINITVTFIPVLASMFLCLGILESSGYMTRAAFIVDRLMRVFGLPGKAFVPLIVGFGCNVPAVMGARTLSSKRERILTIMMTPFMSCSARLAIYAIFVAAFFPIGGQNVIFSLYLIGILVAVLTGLALRTTVLPSERALSMMEMPDYRWPAISTLFRQVGHRLRGFILKAGGLIIVLCVLINGLGSSKLEAVGKMLTPVFAPIGITSENWPATVGLITGLVAKEAVIGTLNSVYTATAGENADSNLDNNLSTVAENEMLKRFGGQIPAYAYLLFTLLYFPCISVVAVIAKELNKKWAAFSVVWSTGLAYIISALFYQAATWDRWYSSSTVSITCLSVILLAVFITARYIVNKIPKTNPKYKLVPTPISVF